MRHYKSKKKVGLSNLIGALLMIIVLVNSLVVLQKYSEQAVDNAIEKIHSETPIKVRAFRLPNGSIGIYNNEAHRVYIKYILLSNSTIMKRDIVLNPFKYTYISNTSNIAAFITDDLHIISVEENQHQTNNPCMYLRKNITGLIGDGPLSRLYEYAVYPDLNGFKVKKKVMYTYSRFLKTNLDMLNEGYKLVVSPLFSEYHVKRYLIKGSHDLVYINLTDGDTGKLNIQYDSFRITVSSKLSNAKSVYLMPVTNKIVLDDEKAIVTYDLRYSTNIRRFYLYVNDNLIDVIKSNNLYALGSVFHVVLNKTLHDRVYITITSTNLNYTTKIPYTYGTKVELRTYREVNSIDINATIELYPSIIVIPPSELQEYTININGSKEVYAVFSDPFKYYTLHLYPNTILPLKRIPLQTKGNGTIFNSTNFGGNVILYYSYGNNYTAEITLGTFVSIISLYNTGNTQFLFYFVVPILDAKPYVIEVYRKQYGSLFQIDTYNNGTKRSYSFTSWSLEQIYVHYPFRELQMYNYIPLIGNAVLEYPTRIGENSSTLIQSTRFNITHNKKLSIDQYGTFNGSVTQVKLCLNSSLNGYIYVEGDPGTVFYLVKPPGINIESDDKTLISQSYIISRIPSEGKLVMRFTVLSEIPP